ncbi:hypothetical protein TRAPUB_11075 [Trametes pubescens]|uniref:Uncharacterized protein n=1 Tax=Trametes pubescens TaxID=154538 RepID=A0A1M2VXS3_TRAPU|nr:hypothetical protein TRAPUB_11075 [Trametes pubescens]
MEDSERSVTPSSPSDTRSVSRGREAISSGRGGIGNIHRPSIDTDSPSRPNGEPMSPVRGREATVDPDRAMYTGRGGMGNIRSGSRARSASKIPENLTQTNSLVSDQAANLAEYEKYVIQQNVEATKARARSSGRGGLGNIKSDSKSRSRSRAPKTPQILSTGRGGAGNLQPGENVDAEHLAQLEDEERLRYAHEGGIHSTGRGGRANLTSLPSPPPEPSSPHAHEYEATGRGGAGNILRSRSASRGPDHSRSRSASRGPSGSKDRGNSLARMLNKVILHQHHDEPGTPGMTALSEDGEPLADPASAAGGPGSASRVHE